MLQKTPTYYSMIFASSSQIGVLESGTGIGFWNGVACQLLLLLLDSWDVLCGFQGRRLCKSPYAFQTFETWKSGMPFSNLRII